MQPLSAVTDLYGPGAEQGGVMSCLVMHLLRAEGSMPKTLAAHLSFDGQSLRPYLEDFIS